MDRYSWSFNRDAEIWYESGETVEDCIAQAENENTLDSGKHEVVYIGENVKIEVNVDVLSMLENLEQSMYEQAGEVAENWDAYEYKKREEWEELKLENGGNKAS